MRLIDANELTTALDGYQHHITLVKKKNRKIEEAILCDVKGIINSAPTIEEQKKGKWEYDNKLALFRCSICQDHAVRKYPYCMHCGAKMSTDDPSHPFADDVMMEDGKDECEKAIDTLKANRANYSETLKEIVDKAIEATEHLI